MSETDELCYVYGITYDDVKLPEGVDGLDDRPIDLVRDGVLAAVVSEVAEGHRIGRKAQLLAHCRVLDALSAQAPVIPLRFGTVVAGRTAVAEELLGAQAQRFETILEQLNGRSQFTLRARYVEERVLTEIVAEDPRVAELREQTRDRPEDSYLKARIELGELVSSSLIRKRETDTPAVLDPIAAHAAAYSLREGRGGVDQLVDVAFLVENDKRAEFEQAAESVARALTGRVRLQLMGPTAAYDFVPEG
jgi:hypothetical protein